MWTLTVAHGVELDELAVVIALCLRLDIHPLGLHLRGGRLDLQVEDSVKARMLASYLRLFGMAIHLSGSACRPKALSPRERELLGNLSEGLQLKEAALRMGVTETTAREYWTRVKEKWKVRTVGHAAALWPELDTPVEPQQDGGSPDLEALFHSLVR